MKDLTIGSSKTFFFTTHHLVWQWLVYYWI